MTFLQRIPLFKERTCHIDIQVKQYIKNPPHFVGPFIKVDHTTDGIWHGNVMLVHSKLFKPTLCLNDNNGAHAIIVKRQVLYECFNFIFTRWDISVRQTKQNMRQNYTILFEEQSVSTREYSFFIPGLDTPWKWAFFSCNDLSHTSGYKGYAEKYGGILPLWTDLVMKHHKYNYNLLVGLGDQVYLDEVWEHVSTLDYWTRIPNRKDRENMAVPGDMVNQVTQWVFHYYLRHFSQPYYDQALATIPSLFVMSDHDTYDGQGSYPEELENSPILTCVREILQKFYLLFQQHQNPDEYFQNKDAVYGDSITPCVKQMGKDLAILALDTRFERTRDRIIKPKTYDYIFSLLEKLPDDIVHLVVATEIPLIFPDIRFAEKVLLELSELKRKDAFNKLFSKLRFYKRIGFPFGEPLTLSDMVDHWNSTFHIDERNEFIFRLQDFAKRKSIRITFIAGDVHCCGVGRFSTPSRDKDKIRAFYENEMMLPFDFAQDHRLMYQIISSAIGNIPPPEYIVKGYHWIDKSEKIKDAKGNITEGRMLRFFLRDTKGRLLGRKAKKLMGKRNWCSVEASSIDGSLFFELHVEMYMGAGKSVPYNIIVPPLDLSGI